MTIDPELSGLAYSLNMSHTSNQNSLRFCLPFNLSLTPAASAAPVLLIFEAWPMIPTWDYDPLYLGTQAY